jgi:outer membrane protein
VLSIKDNINKFWLVLDDFNHRSSYVKMSFIILLLFSHLSEANDTTETTKQTKPALIGFVYGAGIAYREQIYKGYKQRSIALPIIGYINDKFTIFGPFINYSFLKENHWTFDFVVSPRFNGFNQSDGSFFTGMQKRKDSLDAGFNIKFSQKRWSFEFKALHDILSKSDGSSLDLTIARKYKIIGLTVEPSASINQMNSKLTDYYYGVHIPEQTQQRPFYHGRSSINEKMGLSITGFTPLGIVRLDLNKIWYASGITDSPLVDKSNAFSSRLAFIRFF